MEVKDKGTWRAHWRLEKRHSESDPEPYDIWEHDGNLLCNVGINVLLDLLMGAAGTAFTNGATYLGVGNGAAAAAPGNTDLSGGSKTYIIMAATYPIVGTTDITFRSTFGAGDANYAWNEVGCFNGNAPPASAMLNHLVPAGGLGTKAAGASWTLSLTITIS